MTWEEVKLEDICFKIGDGLHGTPSYDDSGEYFFINGNNLNDGKIVVKDDTKRISQSEYLKIKKELSHRTILVGINGTLGNLALYNAEQIALGKSACYINLKEDINKYFIYYYLKSPLFQDYAEIFATGSTIKNLSLKEIRNFKLKLPNKDIQFKIAKLLSNYDDLIKNNNKRIKLLESMAEELYKEWFVRLRFPNYQNTKIEKGIPEGWEVKSLFDISNVIYGFPLKSSLFNDEFLGEPLIRIRDIKSSIATTYTTEQVIDEKYYLKNGDIIVGMDGDFHIGKWSGGKAILNQRIVCFRIKEKISNYFFYFSIKKEIDYLSSVITGTTVAHLSNRDLKKIVVLIPTEELMIKFKNIVDNLFKLEIDLKVKNQILKETRDLLLPRLISGKLDIEEIDIK